MALATSVRPATPRVGDFRISTGLQGGAIVLALQGEADVATLPILAHELSRVIAECEGDVVVDLAQVEFIDTATVRAVLWARAVLAASGRRLTMRSPSRLAERILAIFGLSWLVGPSAEDGDA